MNSSASITRRDVSVQRVLPRGAPPYCRLVTDRDVRVQNIDAVGVDAQHRQKNRHGDRWWFGYLAAVNLLWIE